MPVLAQRHGMEVKGRKQFKRKDNKSLKGKTTSCYYDDITTKGIRREPGNTPAYPVSLRSLEPLQLPEPFPSQPFPTDSDPALFVHESLCVQKGKKKTEVVEF